MSVVWKETVVLAKAYIVSTQQYRIDGEGDRETGKNFTCV